jgi:hypothetical protein
MRVPGGWLRDVTRANPDRLHHLGPDRPPPTDHFANREGGYLPPDAGILSTMDHYLPSRRRPAPVDACQRRRGHTRRYGEDAPAAAGRRWVPEAETNP